MGSFGCSDEDLQGSGSGDVIDDFRGSGMDCVVIVGGRDAVAEERGLVASGERRGGDFVVEEVGGADDGDESPAEQGGCWLAGEVVEDCWVGGDEIHGLLLRRRNFFSPTGAELRMLLTIEEAA